VSEKYRYEDKADVVDEEHRKRRGKWALHSLGWLDFEDVEQIIRLHLYKKWDQWDQDRPLRPWINKIISNQLKNIMRNHYTSFAKPCVTCPFAQQPGQPVQNNKVDAFAEDLCGFTQSGLQCAECPLYAKWQKRKQNAFRIKIPLAIEHHTHEVYSTPDHNSFDLENAQDRLHAAMKKALNERQFTIYEMLYIKNMDEEEVALAIGYKTTEKGRKAGYKQIKNLKKQFKEKAIKLLGDTDILLY